MSLIQQYIDGKLEGQLNKEQTLQIWEEIKSLSPKMMQFVIDTGNGNISDSSEEFDKKIELLEVYSFLVDVICKYH